MASIYRPLDYARDEIRVLEVLDDARSNQRPCFSLRHISLNEEHAQQYDTISYCWGDPALSHQILVDDTLVTVPFSSYKVLSHVVKSGQSRSVWIDAVCINQTDLEERSHQVQLMRKIYSSGQQNIIYLGESESNDREIDTVKDLVHDMKDAVRLAGFDTFDEYMVALWYGDIVIQPNQLPEFDTDSLLAFFERRWFSRVWIVQEVVLSKSNLCVYGNTTFDLQDILQLMAWLSKHPAFTTIPRIYDATEIMNTAFMFEARSATMLEGSVAFTSAFLVLSHAKATDPRDKVFGLLGLCFDGPIPPLLSVDYTKPWQDVYRDATRYIIVSSTREDTATRLPFVLRCVDHHSLADFKDPKHASWVPWYELGNDRSVDASPMFIHDVRALPEDIGCLVNNEKSAEHLSVLGSKLDRIVSVGTVFDNEIFQDTTRLYDEVQQLLETCRHHQYDNDTVARIMMADTAYTAETSTAEDRAGMIDLLQHLATSLPLIALSDLKEDVEPSQMKAATFLTAFREAVKNRRFGVTAAGQVVPVPRLTAPGDIIAAVFCDAGGVPYVLRPYENAFKLVGACYLDGEMPGQSQDLVVDESRRWFTLI